MQTLARSDEHRLRVRIEHDQDFGDIRDHYDEDLLPYVARDFDPYSNRWRDPREAGPLASRWAQIVRRRGDSYRRGREAAEVFARYVRIMHRGAAQVDGTDVYYLLPGEGDGESREELDRRLASGISDLRAWENGEVFGFIVQERVTWSAPPRTEMHTWEEIDSCWGFVGYEHVRTQARESYAWELNKRTTSPVPGLT